MMFIRSVAVAAALLALAGCDDNQVRKFGTTRDGGSTEVRGLPPLSVPPLLAQRPAREGSATPQDASADDVSERGRESDIRPNSRRGRQLAARAPVSRGQESLMEAAGPAAPGNIRERLTSDAQLGAVDPALSERILTESPHSVGLIQQSSPGFWSRIF